MSSYDVIVLGLGGMGSSTVAQLAARGQHVLGLERFQPAHDFGSSHGDSRIIRQAYFESPVYVPLLLRAYELWAQLEADSSQQLMLKTGGIFVGAEQSHVVTGSIRSAEAFNIPHELLNAHEISRRFPMIQPATNHIALYEPDAGVVFPEATIRSCLQVADRRGAELHFGEQVLAWEADPGGDGVLVETNRDTYAAERLIVTAGAWAAQMLRNLNLPLQSERVMMHWFEPNVGVAHFAPGQFPVHIWELEEGVNFYGFPALGGPKEGVKIAFHNMLRTDCDPDSVDRIVYGHEIETMRTYVRRFFPEMDGRHLMAKTCMYMSSPDDDFIIDRHPEFPQVVFATGFSGHGFKFVSVMGEVLAELSCQGRSRHAIDAFSMARFQ